MKKFKNIVAGGTFDHFHKGHEEFLNHALSIADKISIGVTSDKFTKKKSNLYNKESFLKRKSSIEAFVKKQEFNNQFFFSEIDDIFGETLSDYSMDSILVSKNTLKGARKINRERLKRRLPPLKIIIHPFTMAQDKKPISSSRILKGEISRDGKVYIRANWLKKDLLLSKKLRDRLKRPFGKLTHDISKLKIYPQKTITVGDVTTKTFNKLSLTAKISVVDFRVKRKQIFTSLEQLGFKGKEKVIDIKNPPGTLSRFIFRNILKIFDFVKGEKLVIRIEGEEDLVVLPLILAAPLGFVVFYGQPEEGIVRVEVTEENKEKAFKIINKFIQ